MATEILELNLAFQRLLSDDPEADEQKKIDLGEDEDEDKGDDEDEDEDDGSKADKSDDEEGVEEE